MHGPTCIFWANLTLSSLQAQVDELVQKTAAALCFPVAHDLVAACFPALEFQVVAPAGAALPFCGVVGCRWLLWWPKYRVI